MRMMTGIFLAVTTILAGTVRLPQIKNYSVDERLLSVFERQIQVSERLKPYLQSNPINFQRLRNRVQRKGIKFQNDTLYLRVLAIRVEFQEDTTPNTTGNGKFTLTPNNEDSIIVDPETGCEFKNPFWDPPHDKKYFEGMMDALSKYYFQATFGHVKIEYTVKPDDDSGAYQLPHKMEFYGDEVNWFDGLLALFRDALLAADQDTTIDFSQYDKVIIFHAGSAWQTDILFDSPNDIAAVTVLNYPITVDEGRDTIWDASILPETMSQDGVEIKLQGTLIHESGHNLFWLPDLYDTGFPPEGIGIGAWGIMCTGPYLGIKGAIPEGLIVPLPNAWERVWMDWVLRYVYGTSGFLDDRIFKEISPSPQPETLTIYPVEVLTDSLGNFVEDPYSKPRIYKIPINSHEYWLIEQRLDNFPQTDSVVCGGDTAEVFGYERNGVVTHFFGENDYLLPGNGLLIWHVDTLIIHEKYPWNEVEVPRPMGVDLEEADKIQDLEHWTDDPYTIFGSKYDPYFQSNPNEFAPDSSPPSSDNLNRRTGVRIYAFSNPDTVMTFVVVRNLELQNFPYAFLTTPQNAYLQSFDMDLDSLPDILITTVGRFDTLGNPVEAPKIYALSNDLTPIPPGNALKIVLPIRSKVVSEPAIADLNADGFPEIVIPTSRGWNGALYAYSSVDQDGDGYFDQYFSVQLPFSITGGVTIADIDADTLPEILVGDDHNRLFIFQNDGTIRDTIQVTAPVRSNPAVYDSLVYYYSSDGVLFIINGKTGDVINSILNPYVVPSFTNPVIADFNGDEIPEILILAQSKSIYMLDLNGNVLWQREIDSPPLTNAAPADIDGNGVLDFAFISNSKVFAFDGSGNPLNSYPKEIGLSEEAQFSDPVSIDIDDNGSDEILIWIDSLGLIAYGKDGEVVHPTPLAIEGKIVGTPKVLDFDNDGRLEILCIDSIGYIHAFDMNATRSLWTGFAGNLQHTGFLDYSSTPTQTVKAFSRIYVYPNPTYDGVTRLRFEASGQGDVLVSVISYGGRVIKEIRGTYQGYGMVEMDPELDLRDIASGTYLLRVQIRGTDGKAVKFLKVAVLK